jgi:uncharacterized protein
VSAEDVAEDTAATDEGGARPEHAAAVLEHIARSLVETPDEVRVDIDESGHRTQVNLRVADGDMGRIIGKRGRMANAIRTVTRAAAARDGVEIDVEFLD